MDKGKWTTCLPSPVSSTRIYTIVCSGDGRRAMFKLKNDVLDTCLLRRTKETRAEDMNLPPRLVTIRTLSLHPIEEDFYNALYTQTKSSFNDYVSDGTLLNNYAHIFDLLVCSTLGQFDMFCFCTHDVKYDTDENAAISRSSVYGPLSSLWKKCK